MYESALGNGYASFDGRVLETWQPNNDGSGRLHAAVIKAINIMPQGKGQYFMEIETVYRTGTIAFAFPEQHAEIANHIKGLVEQAKAGL